MIQLNDKYVFHMPCYKYKDNKLISLKNDNIIDELINKFNENGYDSLYIIEAKGYYKSRSYDEILITIYASDNKSKSPKDIFIEWFKNRNEILQQESLAYEFNNSLFIEKIE